MTQTFVAPILSLQTFKRRFGVRLEATCAFCSLLSMATYFENWSLHHMSTSWCSLKCSHQANITYGSCSAATAHPTEKGRKEILHSQQSWNLKKYHEKGSQWDGLPHIIGTMHESQAGFPDFQGRTVIESYWIALCEVLSLKLWVLGFRLYKVVGSHSKETWKKPNWQSSG